MLKTRIIPVLYIKNGLIVRSEDFYYHQNIGNILNEAQRYNEWDIDELIYIDISKSDEYDLRRDDLKVKNSSNIEQIIKDISKVCYMPLTFGGKILSLEDVDIRIRNGADKITINTAALDTPQLIKDISKKYGSQCVVVSIDYKIINNLPIVFKSFGTINTNILLFDWIKQVEDLGAGEIFLNSINRDGKANGYDIENIDKAVSVTKLPVIACGGAADEFDILELAKNVKVSGIAAGNMFHFTENIYRRTKRLLLKNNIDVRL